MDSGSRLGELPSHDAVTPRVDSVLFFSALVVMDVLTWHIQDRVSWCMLFVDDIILIDETHSGATHEIRVEVRFDTHVIPKRRCFKCMGSLIQASVEINDDITHRIRVG